MNLDQIIAKYNQELLHYEQQAETSIRSAHSHMFVVVRLHLNALLKQYQEDSPVPAHWLYIGNRLANAKQIVADQVAHFGEQAKHQVLSAQHTAIELGEDSAAAQLGTLIPSDTIKFAGTLHLVGNTQQGRPIADLLAGFGQEASDRVGKALIAGVSIGQKPDTINRSINDALAISLHRALTISRTSEHEAYRSAWFAVMRKNDVARWRWEAEPQACMFCTMMDGTIHPILEDMISHPNCRCYTKILGLGA